MGYAYLSHSPKQIGGEMTALKVLVVDDAVFIRDLITKAMQEHYPSFTIQEAADGLKAQTILKASPVDLVLCDWEMPEMSGLEAIRLIRAKFHQNLPIIFIPKLISQILKYFITVK